MSVSVFHRAFSPAIRFTACSLLSGLDNKSLWSKLKKKARVKKADATNLKKSHRLHKEDILAC